VLLISNLKTAHTKFSSSQFVSAARALIALNSITTVRGKLNYFANSAYANVVVARCLWGGSNAIPFSLIAGAKGESLQPRSRERDAPPPRASAPSTPLTCISFSGNILLPLIAGGRNAILQCVFP